jgi:AraC-like DNA-binding protein
VDENDILFLHPLCPLKAQNAGLFMSREPSMHPTRVIESHELIFIKQGQLDMWENEQRFHLEPGDTLHLWPGRRHGSSCPMPADLRFYWIHFEVLEKGNAQADGSSPLVTKLPQVNSLNQPERLERLFRQFLEDQETGLLHPYAASLLTMLMLIEASQVHVEPTNAAPDDANAVATWAHTYIRINYNRPITTDKVAHAVGYNPDYLGRIYRRVYGCTLTEAIHRRRIHVACEYLLDTNMTIEQIAHVCGFSDADYFRRLFRRYMGASPGTYRDEHSRVHVNTQ